MKPAGDDGRGDDKGPAALRRSLSAPGLWFGGMARAVGGSVGGAIRLAAQHPAIAVAASLLGIVASVLTIVGVIIPLVLGSDGGIPEPEYAQRMQLVACDLTVHLAEKAKIIDDAMAEFQRGPSAAAVGKALLVLRGVVVNELVRADQNLSKLDEIERLGGPPGKYEADHRDYEAALRGVSVAWREVLDATPENVDELTLEQLKEVLQDEHLLPFLAAAMSGLENLEVSEEFKRLSTCQV